MFKVNTFARRIRIEREVINDGQISECKQANMKYWEWGKW